MSDKTPKWFQEWQRNDFSHMQKAVDLHSKILWSIALIILGGAIVNLIFG